MRRSFQPGLMIVVLLACACGQSARGSGSHGTPSGGSDGSGGVAGGGARGGTSGAGQAGEGGDGSTPDPGRSSVSLEGTPIYTRVQRLTNTQWENAVRDILRLDPDTSLAEGFVRAAGTADFSNNEKLLFVGVEEALDFESGSEAAAALATGSPEAIAALDAGDDAEVFVRTVGRRAFRRPLTDEEQAKYQGVFSYGESLYGAGFANGAALVIRALLQSPHFLYRTELGPAGDPLSGYEIASKLSFWLLGTTPSDAVLDAAADGELDSADGLEAFAREMLETSAASVVMRDFHAQLHRFVLFASPDKGGVPDYPPELNAELAEASALFFDRIFANGEGLRDVFTSANGFVGPELAPLYGLDGPSEGFEERDLGPSRLGYFMQVPFLLVYGNDFVPNTIRRGTALHRDVLCAHVDLAHDAVLPVPPDPSQTNREHITELTAGCGGGCHADFINPLGFAFEAFDGMGQYREEDNELPIDSSGSYPFAEGTQEYSDARELMEILANSEQAHTCFAKKLTGYGLQRDMVEPDRPLLEELGDVSREGSLKELVLSLVRNSAFRLRQDGP